ncbi:basic salivary proline-rich protein 2-like isoform X17 [Olea europaea var. sylvestris]|uniref:basic salivary proline-rich protein 2-like isoform X17 n=1 Tax=Olea europaea var. sylvestris TaxID=158386 RepID=UPI000C1D7B1C|nr:basic salivary proline-rich protein 2-like isoform X17 [Olea europaea var. sylvestris]
MANKPEIVQEIEDEEDGPPPGFQSIITQQAPQSNLPSGKAEGGDGSGGEEEGPPPGFHCMNLPAPHSDMETRGKRNDFEDDEDSPPPGWEFNTLSRALPSKPPSNTADLEMGGKQDSILDGGDCPPPGWEYGTLSQALPAKPQSNTADIKMRGKQDGFEDDGDGPPPGWEFHALSQALPSQPPLNKADKKMDSNELHEDEDDGPPPGWETTFPHQVLPPYEPPMQPSLAVSSGREMGSKKEIKNDVEGHPSGSRPESVPEQLSPPIPPPQLLPSSAPPAVCSRVTSRNKSPPMNGGISDKELGGTVDIKIGGERPTSVLYSQPLQPMTLPSQPLPPPVMSLPSGQSTEKAQLVCGTCRKLLLYPRGAKWVQCPGCQEVNLVLEGTQQATPPFCSAGSETASCQQSNLCLLHSHFNLCFFCHHHLRMASSPSGQSTDQKSLCSTLYDGLCMETQTNAPVQSKKEDSLLEGDLVHSYGKSKTIGIKTHLESGIVLFMQLSTSK